MILSTVEPGSGVWFWAAAATIIATLASAVAALYKAQIGMKDSEIKDLRIREESMKAEVLAVKNDYKSVVLKLEEEVKECRKDREELRVEMARMDTRLSMLEKKDMQVLAKAGIVEQRLNELEQK